MTDRSSVATLLALSFPPTQSRLSGQWHLGEKLLVPERTCLVQKAALATLLL